MEYEKVDEDVKYLTACENVKKIVNAIKTIKIKYYPNFASISQDDKNVYNQLEEKLEMISTNNDLDRLKKALMEEVSAKYDKKEIDNKQNDSQLTNDELLMACYGAIDVQKKALSQGKLKQARKCQKLLKQYLRKIDSLMCRELVINYKREKFRELNVDRDLVQKKNEDVMNYMKSCYKLEQTIEGKQIEEKIKEKEAFSEVDEILKIMPIDLLSKIPLEFRQTISKNKSKNYKVDIKEPLEEQNLKDETVVILGVIYREFLASPEEKEKLQLKENLINIEQQINTQNELILYKEPGIVKKLFFKIRSFFIKNKS